jgi:Protein of unknown function (DUF2585)
MLSAMAASDAVDGILQEAEGGTGLLKSKRIRNRRGFLIAGMIALFACALLFLMARPPICTCGKIELWHGALDSGNSQHIADWYSLSHIIHGFLFYAAAWALMRRQPLGPRLAVAVAVESLWEILENSPIIIDRYRTATIALGYSGDTILNSMSDIGMMTLGFAFAARAPVALTALAGIALELLALYAIRDNLTLNVLMLTWPIEALKSWQSAL